MAEEILISSSARETRVAVTEQSSLREILIERTGTKSIVGNIYKGKILRILPGMQSAFVDIGLDRAAFIHLSDIIDPHEAFHDEEPPRDNQRPSIHDLLREGQSLMVQVMKEPISSKGARLTTSLSLASRYLVYMPDSPHIGVSQRIEDEEERGRLRTLVQGLCGEDDVKDGGFIVRTAAELVEASEIVGEADLLRSLWRGIGRKAEKAKGTSLIYEDLPLHLRVMRDLINRNTSKILTDSPSIYEKLQKFIADVIPEKSECLELVDGDRPLFDLYNVEEQIDKALERTVPLKSGGYLVIDQTEAMTTIDVNTGAFVGRKDLEETIYRTNIEAAAAIPIQLRLRNIGGIVIVDFIDMIDEEHKRQVLRILEKGQLQDRVKYRISEISELGLVEMTRKRTRESLAQMMCEPCPTCNGEGTIKTAETICLEIFREIHRKARHSDKRKCLIMASQPIIDRLLDEEASHVRKLSRALAKEVIYQVEATYSQENFDVLLV